MGTDSLTFARYAELVEDVLEARRTGVVSDSLETRVWLYGNGTSPPSITINEHRFWIQRGKVVRRQERGTAPDYDAIAEQYDAMFVDDASREQDERVMSYMPKQPGSVLDVGAGTGLFLQYCHPPVYTGLDPSVGMLNVLKRRNPLYAKSVVACPFEVFYTGRRFELVVSLFGSFNYIHPEYAARVLDYCVGQYAIMVYHPNYEYPKTHEQLGVTMPYYRGNGDLLPGERINIDDQFVLIRGEV